ncbi:MULTISPECIES: SDR family NAD(P)-dependent oxidoreductase [Streptomyces]|uniref:SDR family NAD(P)-dependent oxidoreductase n=1 Tax=Streptomyces TaxID=1883 RepID=UPI0006AD3CE7|nr:MULTISPECIES: SDR family oxidoreductase [Streptomyces]ALC27014.1 short-chain dehydrogenase [Streptomyces sp. CFMR 7]RZF06898.1 NAD(P)-dependent oxidoreductase [Streptomyces albidoflavus]
MSRERRAALVTGASRGIGRAIAFRLAEEGFDLTLSGRDAAALREAGAECARKADTTVATVPADMAKEADVRRLAEAHRDSYGRLDLLVLSAGVGSAGSLGGYPVRRFDKQFSVNVRAPFLLIDACMDLLRRTAPARIVAVSSLTGRAPEPGLAAYGASKAALSALCEAINTESSAEGVSATALQPGYVDTEMSSWAHDRISPDEMITSGDLAELVVTLTRLSPRSVVPYLPVVRAGTALWRA